MGGDHIKNIKNIEYGDNSVNMKIIEEYLDNSTQTSIKICWTRFTQWMYSSAYDWKQSNMMNARHSLHTDGPLPAELQLCPPPSRGAPVKLHQSAADTNIAGHFQTKRSPDRLHARPVGQRRDNYNPTTKQQLQHRKL